MRAIATWSFAPWLKSVGSHWERTEYMLATTRASIEYAYKWFGRPLIYTDTLGEKIFSQLTDKADYAVIYDDVFEDVNPRIWAFAKIMTYGLQKQPYLHFDLDFWFLKPLTAEQMDCDILCHAFEILDQNVVFQNVLDKHYNMPQYGRHYRLPEMFRFNRPNSVPAVNMGCVLMNNMDLHQLYVSNVAQLIDDNMELLNSNKALDICVIEQHTMGMILHRNPQFRCKEMFPGGWSVPPVHDQAIHFVGENYKTSKYPAVVDFCRKHVDPWVDQRVWNLTDELNEMRKAAKLS